MGFMAAMVTGGVGAGQSGTTPRYCISSATRMISPSGTTNTYGECHPRPDTLAAGTAHDSQSTGLAVTTHFAHRSVGFGLLMGGSFQNLKRFLGAL